MFLKIYILAVSAYPYFFGNHRITVSPYPYPYRRIAYQWYLWGRESVGVLGWTPRSWCHFGDDDSDFTWHHFTTISYFPVEFLNGLCQEQQKEGHLLDNWLFFLRKLENRYWWGPLLSSVPIALFKVSYTAHKVFRSRCQWWFFVDFCSSHGAMSENFGQYLGSSVHIFTFSVSIFPLLC